MAGETWIDLVQSMTIKIMAQKRALAEREASIVELRRALVLAARSAHVSTLDNSTACACPHCSQIRAALAQPAPQAALRAFGLKVLAAARPPYEGDGELVDAVLKGES